MTAAVMAILVMTATVAAADRGSQESAHATLRDFWAGDIRALHVWVSPDPTVDEAAATAALAAFAARRAHPTPLDIHVHVRRDETSRDGGLDMLAVGLPSSARAVVFRAGAEAGIRFHQVRAGALDTAAGVLEFPTSRETRDRLCDAPAEPADAGLAACESPCCATQDGRRGWRLVDFARDGAEASVQTFTFSQADLGGPTAKITLDLSGIHAPIARGRAADLEILFNGGLINTIRLGGTGRFAFTVPVPRALVQRDNTVLLRVVSPGSEPPDVQLDPEARIRVEPGQRLTAGFQRFPQVLIPRFQVSVDQLTPATVQTLAQVVGAMQRASRVPLVPEVVPWTVGRASRLPWIAIATDPDTGGALHPPVPLTPFRVLGLDREELVRSDEATPVASLQAFVVDGRDVLLLSHHGWPEGVSALTRELTRTGVPRLAGDVWVAASGRLPFSFHAGGGGLRIERLAGPAPRWMARARAGAFGLAASVLTLALVWSYPRVVRPRPGL